MKESNEFEPSTTIPENKARNLVGFHIAKLVKPIDGIIYELKDAFGFAAMPGHATTIGKDKIFTVLVNKKKTKFLLSYSTPDWVELGQQEFSNNASGIVEAAKWLEGFSPKPSNKRASLKGSGWSGGCVSGR
jgi:hypothetical protein